MDREESKTQSQRLHDLKEQQDMPRERLIRLGRSALSDEELIALFLRTGLPGMNVLELSAHIKRKAGSLAALGSMEGKDIAALAKGIGPAKAATLAAVFELGQRAVKESLQSHRMDDAQTVYEYLSSDLRFEPQETMVALLLDTHHRLIRRVNIAKGTLTRVNMHPRDVFREAIRHNAQSIILAHNHPSGDPTPSKADIKLTEQMQEAGEIMLIRILDHIIIGSSDEKGRLPYYSFFAHGLIK